MKKLLLVIFLLSFHILSFAPNISNEEKKQNLTKSNLFNHVSYAISKMPMGNINLSAIPIVSPIDTTTLAKVNSYYGKRNHPILFMSKTHKGIDIDAKINTLVRSTANGYVEKVEYKKHGYGNYIIINHQNGYKTRYAHLSSVCVKEGDIVIQNMPIGRSGRSGLTTGPHLHYEIIHNDNTIDPVLSVCENKDEYIDSLKKIQFELELYKAII
jgi:murein DD-endopeptidase MepM/ murein hydrolase activator NlpD